MARFIASARNPLWPAQEAEMRSLFGVGSKWPKEGCKLRFIQGIAVHVLPADHISLRKGPGVAGKRQVAHRVIAACPDCGKAVSAGRLRQHKCGSKPRKGGKRFVDRTFQTAEINVAKSAVPDLRQLAQAVYVHAWETQEYEDAFNRFCEEAGNRMNRKQRLEWDRWCLKATSNEIIDEALRILGLDPVPAPAATT
jgi:hypothetical protein